MRNEAFFLENHVECDACLLTSRENKYYMASLYSASGYVFVCKEKTYVLVDGRYYTDMKQKNKRDTILLIDEENPFWQIINHLAEEHGIYSVGIENSMELSAYRKLSKKLLPKLVDLDLSGLRCVKRPEEVACIKSACAIAVKTFEFVKSFIRIGMTEEEIANEMVYFMRKNGAQRESFETIVLSGERGALPHGKPSQNCVNDGDFIVMDFGAVSECYCSDITRTIQVGTKDNMPLKKIYNSVLKAQKAAISAIRPGLPCSAIDTIARKSIEKDGYGLNFSHNLGHSMGILCHEEPRFSPKDMTILKPGMILTVEPGIYVEGLGGVRIEDDILVTDYGCEVLTEAAEKDFTRIEG